MTIAPYPTMLRVGSQTVDLTTPVVMTIINVTPDSFYAGSRTASASAIAERVRQAAAEGAVLLDVGGYSSRPGADDVPPEEETRRLALALEVIRRETPQLPVSLDTFRSAVAERIIRDYGPCIINDITGGEADPKMFETTARLGVPYIVMHMRGMPDNMQQLTDYRDITAEIYAYLEKRSVGTSAYRERSGLDDPGGNFTQKHDI